MKVISVIIRTVLGLFVGLTGCLALLNAPYQLLNSNFSFGESGVLMLVSLILGGVMLWSAWQIIRRPRLHVPAR